MSGGVSGVGSGVVCVSHLLASASGHFLMSGVTRVIMLSLHLNEKHPDYATFA